MNCGILNLVLTTVRNNSADNFGGGIHQGCPDTNTHVSQSIISGNTSDTNGGGIHHNGGTFAVMNSTVSQNTSGIIGGGIYQDTGAFSLTASTVSANNSTNNGGGIYQGKTGILTINGSTLSGNTSNTRGGGIYQLVGGTLTLNNSTISGNLASDRGGGIRSDGGTVNLNNVTITANTGVTAQGGMASGSNTTFNLKNTIVAGNVSVNQPDCAGAFASGGNNLIGIANTSCSGFVASDLTGTTTTPRNPQLGPLANNGGNTFTHALLTGSPAIDTGSTTAGSCATSDQRGTTRPRDGNNDGTSRCDIGAFELVNPASANIGVALTDTPDPVVVGTNYTYTMTISNAGPNTATNVTAELTLPAGTTFVSTSNPNCKENTTNLITCDPLGNINNGSNLSISFTVKAPNTTGTLNTKVSVKTATPETVTNNNAVEIPTTVSAGADLAMDLIGDSNVNQGVSFNYIMNIRNNGMATATAFSFEQTLPTQVTFTSVSSSNCSFSSSTRKVTCSFTGQSLASGSTTSVTVSVIASTTGAASSTASILSSTPTDPNSANNSDSASTTINPPSADIDLRIPAPTTSTLLSTNQSFVYRFNVINNGPLNASSVVLTVSLPSGVTNISIPASCSRSSLVVTCPLDTILATGNKARSITVTAPSTPGNITVFASATSSTFDANSINNSRSRTNTVQ